MLRVSTLWHSLCNFEAWRSGSPLQGRLLLWLELAAADGCGVRGERRLHEIRQNGFRGKGKREGCASQVWRHFSHVGSQIYQTDLVRRAHRGDVPIRHCARGSWRTRWRRRWSWRRSRWGRGRRWFALVLWRWRRWRWPFVFWRRRRRTIMVRWRRGRELHALVQRWRRIVDAFLLRWRGGWWQLNAQLLRGWWRFKPFAQFWSELVRRRALDALVQRRRWWWRRS